MVHVVQNYFWLLLDSIHRLVCGSFTKDQMMDRVLQQ
jgi:hypothetical protein